MSLNFKSLKQRSINCFCLVLIFIFIATSGWALTTKNSVGPISGISITPVEFSHLPEFLQVKVLYHHTDHGNPLYVEWEKKMGVDYMHYHHWAAAIVKFERAVKIADKNKREWAIDDVANEYKYLLTMCTKENTKRYLFHYARGEALMIKGDVKSAMIDFNNSIKLNRNFTKAYLKLSEAYIMIGLPNEAKKVMAAARNNQK